MAEMRPRRAGGRRDGRVHHRGRSLTPPGTSAAAALLVALLGGVPTDLAGQDDSSRDRTRVVIGTNYERVSDGRADWRDFYIRVDHAFGARRSVYGTLLRAERFGRTDHELSAGVNYPLGPLVTGNVHGSVSPSPAFLPQWSAGGWLHHALGSDWAVRGGADFRRYNQVDVTLEHGQIERYFGPFRAAYRLTFSQVREGTGIAHRLQGDYSYGSGGVIRLFGGIGEHVETVGADDVRSVDIRSAGISGRQPVGGGIALGYEFAWYRHGEFFDRTRVLFGVQRSF